MGRKFRIVKDRRPTRFIAAIACTALLAVSPCRAQSAAADATKADEAAANLVRGNVEQAVASYTEALKDTGLANDRRAALLNDRAVAYVRAGQVKLALEDYNRAVQIFAEYPAAYNNRGNLLLSLGQPGEAVKDFDRAIVLAPGYAAAHSNRAAAKVRVGDYAEAIGDFTRAIELMPASAPPLSGRGLAYLATGKPHAAIRDFSRAVNADARFASAYRNRAEARINVGQSDEAIEDLSRAIAFDPANSEIYVVRGYAYLAVSNTASAMKDFARAIELDPRSPAAYQARGLANGLAEAFEDAYADLNRAIELNPRSPIAFAYRAYLYKLSGQPEIGQKDVETALKLDEQSAEVLWARGEIAEARGQTDAAIADLRKALSLKPGWRLAADAIKRLGVETELVEDREIPGLGVEGWRVVARSDSYFAVADAYPALRVPLEMMGEGKPQLAAWEPKAPPHQAYGVLRYSGGTVAGKAGPEDVEFAAIIDIEMSKVVGIQPNKQGARVAGWIWEDDRVQIASIDGVTDEFALRATAPPPTGPATIASPRRQRARGSGWDPWNDPIGGVGSSRGERSAQRRQKPKSLFDLLFKN